MPAPTFLTLDFETYYDKDYSLGKMTTEEYVRDPRFEIILVSAKINDQPAQWFDGQTWLMDLTKEFYASGANLDNIVLLSHNTAFDGFILNQYQLRKNEKFFNVKFYLDTMSMARPKHALTTGVSLKALAEHYEIGDKGDEVLHAAGMRRADFNDLRYAAYGAYCTQDVELTYQLFQKLKVGFPVSELKLIDQTLRMFIEPRIEVSKSRAKTFYYSEVTRKKQLVAQLQAECGPDTLNSNPKFAEYLRSLGVEPPTKISKTTGKQAFAFAKTDKEFLKLREHPDKRVQIAVSVRLGTKSTLDETRALALSNVADRGPLPVMLNYYGAHSGRFSGGDRLNLQNLPRGGELRKALMSPAGYMFVAGDSSQIEARVLAYIAGQHDLVQAFREGRDVYSEFASSVYERKITKADKLERFVGKTCILGLGYGMGHARFREALALGQGGIKVELTEDEAKRIVRLYRTRNQWIANLWDKAGVMLRNMVNAKDGTFSDIELPYKGEEITFPNGLGLTYPNLKASEDGFTYTNRKETVKLYGAKAVENVVQGLARIVVSDQMLTLEQLGYRPCMQVHDEIVVTAKDVVQGMHTVQQVMSMPPVWAPDLPVACEVGSGISYGECK